MITKDIEHLTTLTNKDAVTTFGDLLDYSLWVFGVPIKGWPYKPEVSKEFYKAFVSLVMDYKHGINTKGWCDPLGDTFMSLISGVAKYRGQFFTPEGICRLMADITIDDKAKEAPKHPCGVYGFRTIMNDPTCGSGRGLLAIKAKYASMKEEDQPYFIGEDIDALCCKMTALNLCVHGCYGEVICHNTLSEPDTLRFGYLINVGLRYGQPPSITYSDNPLMFETTTMRPMPGAKPSSPKPQTPVKPVTSKPTPKPTPKPHRSEPTQLSLF